VLGRLILVFVFVPLADLVLLLVLAQYTGWKFSVAAVVISGIIGALLAKMQSAVIKGQILEKLQQNQLPAELLSDGAMIFFAAGLLLTPGFITDFVGFTLLIPVCRNWYKRRIKNILKNSFKFEFVQINPAGQSQIFEDPNVIDGEVLDSTVVDSPRES